jgi:hypothetical protein
MHVAIALTMGMYLFSLVMIVLNVTAFGASTFCANREQVRLQPDPAGA